MSNHMWATCSRLLLDRNSCDFEESNPRSPWLLNRLRAKATYLISVRTTVVKFKDICSEAYWRTIFIKGAGIIVPKCWLGKFWLEFNNISCVFLYRFPNTVNIVSIVLIAVLESSFQDLFLLNSQKLYYNLMQARRLYWYFKSYCLVRLYDVNIVNLFKSMQVLGKWNILLLFLVYLFTSDFWMCVIFL